MSKRRVVVTGMGMLSPLGNDITESWHNLLQGKSGVDLITKFDTSDFTTKFAAELKNFNSEDYFSRKESRKMDPFIQYGFVAAKQAIEDSGFVVTDENRSRIGIAVGSGIGGLGLIQENNNVLIKSGPRRVSPFFVPSTIINMTAGQISIHYKLQGPNIAIATACTSGVHNIGMAVRTIMYDDADIMVAGGSECASNELGLAGFGAMKALSTRNDSPQQASRPWDKDRDGFVLGDGAGVVILEEYEHAKARGAKIYAEVVGFGMSGDGYHMTSPPANGEGAMLAMKNALRDAKLDPAKIGYVNAHGTSTGAGDLAEARAISNVFAGNRQLLVSSTKSSTGHLLGAAGAVESIFSILSLANNQVPATINLDNPEPEITLDLVPHTARDFVYDYSLCNSFGFGGTNGCLIFKKI